MTASEFAARLHGRRVGKGKWLAKCPAHPDCHPSLSISEGRKVPIVMKCMSAGCETQAILAAMGLGWNVLFDRKLDREARMYMANEEKMEHLVRQRRLMIWLQSLDKGKRAYWEVAERNLISRIEPLYWEIMPDLARHEKTRAFEEKDYRLKCLD